MSRTLVAATGNPGKLAELERLLDGLGWEVVAQSAYGVEPPPEDGLTFVENAIIKTRHAAERTGRPALADDSGLVVDALDGAPGVRSARYAGEGSDDAANNEKLLRALAGVPEAERTARFECAVVWLRDPRDPVPLIARGTWAGRVLDAPRGANGFGYDPLFLDPAAGLTAAELSPERKDALSHRGKALQALRAKLCAESGCQRIQNLFGKLCLQPESSFPDSGQPLNAPPEQGVYIIRKGGAVLHVGRTLRGKRGLHQRLMNHLNGKSSFTNKYLKGNGASLRKKGYTFQFLVENDPRRRALLEAFATGKLCPKHLGLGE